MSHVAWLQLSCYNGVMDVQDLLTQNEITEGKPTILHT